MIGKITKSDLKKYGTVALILLKHNDIQLLSVFAPQLN